MLQQVVLTQHAKLNSDCIITKVKYYSCDVFKNMHNHYQ